jgi:hypothetical protein
MVKFKISLKKVNKTNQVEQVTKLTNQLLKMQAMLVLIAQMRLTLQKEIEEDSYKMIMVVV